MHHLSSSFALYPLVTVSALCLTLPALAQPAQTAATQITWRTDYNTARKEAAEKGLPLLVVLGSDDCVYCRKLEAGPLKDPTVTNLIATSFIPLKVNASRTPELAKALKVQLYPTTVLAGPDGKIHAFIEGYVEADRIAEQLKRTATQVITPERIAREELQKRQSRLAHDLLAAARDDFRAERMYDCMQKCEQLTTGFAELPEAKDATAILDDIRGNPERLAKACEQMNDRTAATYLTLAESWVKKGQNTEAALCLKKVIALCPNTKHADTAYSELTKLQGKTPAIPTGLTKP